jgi:hypothetical protein
VVAAVLLLIHGSASVSGQGSCTFVRGFASLRDLVGAQKVGACLEDERFNGENGNAEQRTTGGLMVWRKADNFTAFTDGGTTWVNGPNGLQSRANAERFSWEKDPPASGSAPAAAAPPASAREAAQPGRSAGPPSGSTTAAGSGATANAASSNSAAENAALAAAVAAQPTVTATPAVNTPTPAPTATATPPAPTATATITRTPTATPNPVQAKFDELPDINTGNDAKFVVETNVKKGTCTLTITYKSTAAAGIGTVDVDDGKCEWHFNVAETTKTGKARAEVVVTGTNPAGTTTFDDDFDVKKGDEVYVGDINVDLEVDKFPDEAKIGGEVEIGIDSDQGNKGSCELTINWPSVGAVAQETKKTSDGKCSWRITVPTTITKKGTANVTMIVRSSKNSAVYRQVTKEFEVKLS